MANPIDITSRIYKVLTELFGPKFARDMIGTATNVTKPVKLDPNAPTAALYSNGALRSNPGAEGLAEQKIMEYAPSILSNKNKMEQMNFLENAETLLEIRKGKTTKDGVPIEKTKPEENFFENTEPADVIDLKTKTKVDEKGIASLKDRFGLPEGIDPRSSKGQFIQSIQRAEADTREAEELAKKGLEDFLGFGREVQGPDLLTEARRRAVVREILLNDKRIDLPPAIRKSLKNRDDLSGGADQNLDPLNIYDTYYERNITKLEALDGIIEGSRSEKEAVDEFVKEFDGFDLKPKVSKEKPVVRESIDDELVELEETKNLDNFDEEVTDRAGEIIDEDIDPDKLAKGGRPGAGLDYLMGV